MINHHGTGEKSSVPTIIHHKKNYENLFNRNAFIFYRLAYKWAIQKISAEVVAL